MAIYIPFNHNPASRDLKTAAYTIPAGQYAFVKFLGYDEACLIGGDTVIPALSVTDTQTLSATSTNFYAPPTGYNFEGYMTFWENSTTASDGFRFGIRAGGTDYWFLALQFGGASSSTLANLFTQGTTTSFNSALGAAGLIELVVPSGSTLSYEEAGDISARVIVMGKLRFPISADSWWHVPTGVEVDASSFEVVLFNEA